MYTFVHKTEQNLTSSDKSHLNHYFSDLVFTFHIFMRKSLEFVYLSDSKPECRNEINLYLISNAKSYLEDLPRIFIFCLLPLCPLLARLPSVCNTWNSPVAMRWFSSTSGFAVAVLKVITFFSWKQIVWVTDHSKLSSLSTYSTEMCKGISPKRMLIVALSHQQNDRTNISIWRRTCSNAWYLYEGKHAIDP